MADAPKGTTYSSLTFLDSPISAQTADDALVKAGEVHRQSHSGVARGGPLLPEFFSGWKGIDAVGGQSV